MSFLFYIFVNLPELICEAEVEKLSEVCDFRASEGLQQSSDAEFPEIKSILMCCFAFSTTGHSERTLRPCQPDDTAAGFYPAGPVRSLACRGHRVLKPCGLCVEQPVPGCHSTQGCCSQYWSPDRFILVKHTLCLFLSVPVGPSEQYTLSKGRNSEELMSKLILTDDEVGRVEVWTCQRGICVFQMCSTNQLCLPHTLLMQERFC